MRPCSLKEKCIAYDEVIEDLYSQDLPGPGDSFGHVAVIAARFRLAQWVIVGQDDARGARLYDKLEYLPGADEGACEGTDGDGVGHHHGVLHSEQEDNARLAIEVRYAPAQQKAR